MLFTRPDFSSSWQRVERTNSVEPMVQISIKASDGSWQPVEAKIDTGAAMTFLPRSYCEILGYVDDQGVMRGNPKTFLGAGRNEIHTHVIPLDIQMNGKTFFNIRIAFWDEDRDSDCLLGRTDLFSYFQIALRQKISKSFFTLEP